MNLQETNPHVYGRMSALEQVAHEACEKAGMEPARYEWVKTCASQINGCAFCLDLHTKDARTGGEGEQRFHMLSAWPETSFFSQRSGQRWP